MKNVYAVIMAGGMGERFWPKSRQKHPKQLLPIVVKKHSMLQETVARARRLVPKDKILIITNKVQAPLVRKQLPYIPKRNIISEPLSRNTAPCIALAASIIKNKGGGAGSPACPAGRAVMVVLPADHVLKNGFRFRRAIKEAVKLADEKRVLVTLGIKPSFPHTGYGYIKIGRSIKNGFYKVAKFTEKPDFATAKGYVKSRRYFWNSGMFIWRVDTILEEISKYTPNILKNLKNYKRAPNISVDYGVMEKTTRAVVKEADFAWDDVGDWAALEAHLKKDKSGNIIQGEVVVKDADRSIIITDSPLVAASGISDMIVVATGDSVLVCPKEKAQDVKEIVRLLKKGHKKYL